MLQLHGDEGPSYCARGGAPHRAEGDEGGPGQGRARRALAVRATTPTSTCSTPTCPARYGGTGERFDWELAAAHPANRRWCSPAGSTRRTWREAIGVARPFAVDVASGVEAAPGRKDPDKLRGFFEAVESAAGPRLTGLSGDRAGVEQRFGRYGGRYVPETLMPALAELERRWLEARADPALPRAARRAARALRRPPDAALPRRAALGARGLAAST